MAGKMVKCDKTGSRGIWEVKLMGLGDDLNFGVRKNGCVEHIQEANL